jgi:uncharacterized protein with HEPN domain
MSKKRNVRLLLIDIADAIDTIELYLSDLNEQLFYQDRKTKDAVVRNLEIIGEASNQVPFLFKENNPRIKWREITDLRNRIIHEYFGIDYVLIWEIIEMDIPELKKEIQFLLKNMPEE